MARVIPDGWETISRSGPVGRELETLAVLAAQLPDDYTVYHAVHWTRIEHSHAIYGEIDFVVVNRAGHLLVIEQKSGFLEETADGLAKQYAGKIKLVPVQMGRTVDALRGKLMRSLNGLPVIIEHLLFCPDHLVRHPLTAGLSPERIVDSGRREQLARIIQAILPPGETQSTAQSTAERVHRFLRDIIQLETDVSVLIGQARTLVTRVAGGLAHWARQIDVEPYRLRVTGTAGSGKTQLALAEYRAAIERGRRPLYVCFNRPLADHFALIAPAGGLACTVHMLCDQMLRYAGHVPDFTRPDVFARLLVDAAQLEVPEAFRFDVVIVDEGQDFAPAWRDLVLRHARPDARLLWLEDPLQNLYDYPSVALPGWIGLRATSNFRSPRPIVGFLQTLLPADQCIEAEAPISSAEVEILSYADDDGMLQSVKDGFKQCYASGFRKGDVVLLSFRGRDHSRLLGLDQIGPQTLRRFTGEYDLLGQPVYAQGDVLMESVYRFKGQSAPAVVLAEVDFDTLDPRALRKLFVGATRATMKLVLVASARAARVLAQQG